MHDSGTSNASVTLPSSSEYSATVDYVEAKTQMAEALGFTSPMWSIGSDKDSSAGDSAHQTTMCQQQQQQLSRCEELSSRKGKVTLDMDSAHQCNSKQARNLQTAPRPSAEPPLSPIDMSDRERTKLEEKRSRNRIAQANCRKRQLDLISRLQKEVKALEKQKTGLESEVNDLLERLSQETLTRFLLERQIWFYLTRHWHAC
ncbi:transcription factor kayak-like [Rhipicephalus sanguineus]|uniref:transcription factor kayak-like n=1 Tax=Rhipicephalus sanguineus TaxID=34632 RepID=UPI001894C8FA|nr:transcription factor kayak-like [Rhipicephalus sanguineus]